MKVILINGKAGTGKTYLINEVKKIYSNAIYGGTTWVSSLLTNSETYYRKLHQKINYEFDNNQIIHKKIHRDIIIDEASMLSSQQLDWLKKHYPNCNIILVGDFNQLSPVDGDQIRIDQIDISINLNINHRAKDNRLIVLLDNILNNSITQDDLNLIQNRTITDQESFSLNCMGLYYTNVKRHNHNFKWSLENMKDKHSIGAKLIVKKSYFTDDNIEVYKPKYLKNIYNNEFFTVIMKTETGVMIKNERTRLYITYKDLNWFELAEATTIHKVQGRTISDNIVVNLDSIFIMKHLTRMEKAKLLYVACSRVKSIDNLYFTGKIGSFYSIYLGPTKYDLVCDNEYLIELAHRFEYITFSLLLSAACGGQSKEVYTSHSYNIYDQQVYTSTKQARSLSVRDLAHKCKVSIGAIQKQKKKGLNPEQILDYYGYKIENKPILYEDTPDYLFEEQTCKTDQKPITKQINEPDIYIHTLMSDGGTWTFPVEGKELETLKNTKYFKMLDQQDYVKISPTQTISYLV